MPRIKLVIEYDGSRYSGWQSQKNQPTIQDAIERALATVFKQQISITGSGRTDTGVHARNQIAHTDVPETDLHRLKRSLNGLLAETIVIKDIGTCDPDFHARYDAVSRRYRYYISRVPAAINRGQVWQVFYPLNLVLMQYAADRIKSVSDFKSFCKTGSETKHHLCRIMESKWIVSPELWIYEIIANRFLHGMVRALVGTWIEIGRGKMTLQEFERICAAGNRNLVPFSAPAKGLFLEEVSYS